MAEGSSEDSSTCSSDLPIDMEFPWTNSVIELVSTGNEGYILPKDTASIASDEVFIYSTVKDKEQVLSKVSKSLWHLPNPYLDPSDEETLPQIEDKTTRLCEKQGMYGRSLDSRIDQRKEISKKSKTETKKLSSTAPPTYHKKSGFQSFREKVKNIIRKKKKKPKKEALKEQYQVQHGKTHSPTDFLKQIKTDPSFASSKSGLFSRLSISRYQKQKQEEKKVHENSRSLINKSAKDIVPSPKNTGDEAKLGYVDTRYRLLESEFQKEECKKFCEQFETFVNAEQKYLLYKTWMGYIPNEDGGPPSVDDIRIVAVFNSAPHLPLWDNFGGIPIYWRKKDSVSEEGKQTANLEEIDTDKQRCLSGDIVRNLFDKHSNLNIIHLSSVRSKKFASSEQVLTKELCVALYCHIKGVVPLGENIFPKELENMKTDVREGYCKFIAGDDLRSGTAIACTTSKKSGTIGGFVEDTQGRVAFITAAHIVASCADLRQGSVQKEEFFASGKIKISRGSNPNETIGEVVKGCFWNDDCNQSSVDAVLVGIDRQLMPVRNMFPEYNYEKLKRRGYTGDTSFKICNNKMLRHNEIAKNRQSDILKYGTTTDLTIGRLAIYEINVRLYDEDLKVVDVDIDENEIDSEHFLFFRQMGVLSCDKTLFFENGDSGAFCFMVDKENTLCPFGMAIAKTTSDVCLVTPLEEIFNKLGLDLENGIKLFPTSHHLPSSETPKSKSKQEDTKGSAMEKILQTMTVNFQLLNQRLDNLETNINQRLETIEERVMSDQE